MGSVNTQPNILIVQTDQQRWDVTEPGHPCGTPNLDRMAREGVRFDNVFPPMAHCCPSRASLMTGLYPSQHGVWNNVQNCARLSSGLNAGVECWSESLRRAGYNLNFSGKWHVSADENPADRGWNEGRIFARKNSNLHAMGQALSEWPTRPVVDTPMAERHPGQIVKPGWGDWWMYGTSEEHRPDYVPNQEKPWDDGAPDALILHSALDQLDACLAGDQPWLNYVGLLGPHDPFIVPEHYLRKYDPDAIELPTAWDDPMTGKPDYFRRQKRCFDQMSEREKREAIAHYWAYCTMMDDLFGELLAKLEAAGQLDRTVVIFCSDHGEFLGEHGLYLKGVAPYDGGYKVPFLIRAPEFIAEPGRRVSQLVSLMDLCPTLVELTGCEAPNAGRADGASLLPFLRGETPADWRDAVYFQCNGTEVYFSSRTVRTEKWKLIYNAVAMDELYDLENDPAELRNLADDPDLAEVKKSLYARLWQLARASDDDWISCNYPPVSLADWGPKVVES